MVCLRRLDLQPQAELHYAWTAPTQARIALRNVRRLGDESRGTRAGVYRAVGVDARGDKTVGQREVRMVENIEDFPTELQLEGFAKFKNLGEGEVHVLEARPVDLIAPKIPKRAARRLRERVWVQVALVRCPVGIDGVYTGDHVRSLVKIERTARVVRIHNPNGASRLQSENGVPLPAVAEQLWQKANRRHLIVQGSRPAMARVEGGWTLFGLPVGRILWERGSREVENDHIRGAIERLHVRVRRESGDAVPVLQPRRELPRVIRRAGPRAQDVNDRVIRVDKVLVQVIQSHQPRALGSHIARFECKR